MGAGISLILLSDLETLFLLLGCLVQPQQEGIHLVLLYLVFSFYLSSLGDLLFSKEEIGVGVGS